MIDRLLVEGELVADEQGKEVRRYPRFVDIAQRLGVSPSYISQYAKSHRCIARRKELRVMVASKAQERAANREAKRIVFDEERRLALIDGILEHFDERVKARDLGPVRASDVNLMMRLRRFEEGDPDSRREIMNTTVTLEMLTEAHKELLAQERKMTAQACGMEAETWNSDAAPNDDDNVHGAGEALQ